MTFIVLLLLLTIPYQIISASGVEESKETEEDPSPPIRSLRYYLGRFVAKNLKRINTIFWTAVKADPPVMEISYGETSTLDFGMLDLDTNEFDKRELRFYLNSRALNFEVVEYPDNNPENWFINFNPSSVNFKEGVESEFRTKVSISLRSPPMAENAIQSGILRLRIRDVWATGNLWFPPKEFGSLNDRFRWFTIALIGRWGNLSGTINVIQRDVDVLVNVKSYHAVRFDSIPVANIRPGRIDSIPITLQNLGNYNDTFNFRVANESNGILLSNPISITLKPGETSNTLLAVAVPLNALDTGTLHTVVIQAYSIDQPEATIAERTVIIQTQGIYVSDLSGSLLVFFGIILLVIIGFYLYLRKQKLEKICKKPEKPWLIPGERKHLEKLKLKDNNEYNKTFKMMEEEYKSSMLWYKYYKKSLLKKGNIIKNTVKSITNPIIKFTKNFNKNREEKRKKKIAEMKKAERERKKLEKKKEKQEKVEIKEEIKTKRLEPEPPIEEEQIEPIVDRSAEIEKLRRERTLLKIRKSQEKQRRKFGRFSY